MSAIPPEFVQCPSPSSAPNLIYTLATQQDWWSYRQLRALHPNLSHGQLFHRPFYHPATHLSFTEPTPIQVGTEHYFEWVHSETRIPLVAFHFIIHPTFTFSEPLFTFGSVIVVYFSQYFSHFSDIFYTLYFHFICIFRYVFHFFHYVYLNAYGQFPYLILSWLSYCSKPTSPSFYFISLFSQITHSGTRQTKLL